MRAELTQSDAQMVIESRLTEVIAALPPEVHLAREHPEHGRLLSPGNTVPCDDWAAHESWTLGVSYWIVGIPTDRTREYLDRIHAVFEAKRWQSGMAKEGESAAVSAKTPDGYTFRIADNNHGTLAVSSSSPCFSTAGRDDSATFPETIQHP